MRRKLTVLMAAMITVCGLAGCGGKTPEASQAETAVTAKGADGDWYMEALTDEALIKDYPFHCFVDVNGDGVPVLFMSSTEDSFIGDGNWACMIIEDHGSAKIVKEIGGKGGERFYCNPAEHTVTWFSRMSGEGHFEVYRVTDGSLEIITTSDWPHLPSPPARVLFSLPSTQISAAPYCGSFTARQAISSFLNTAVKRSGSFPQSAS